MLYGLSLCHPKRLIRWDSPFTQREQAADYPNTHIHAPFQNEHVKRCKYCLIHFVPTCLVYKSGRRCQELIWKSPELISSWFMWARLCFRIEGLQIRRTKTYVLSWRVLHSAICLVSEASLDWRRNLLTASSPTHPLWHRAMHSVPTYPWTYPTSASSRPLKTKQKNSKNDSGREEHRPLCYSDLCNQSLCKTVVITLTFIYKLKAKCEEDSMSGENGGGGVLEGSQSSSQGSTSFCNPWMQNDCSNRWMTIYRGWWGWSEPSPGIQWPEFPGRFLSSLGLQI